MADDFEVHSLTGAQVLHEKRIPEVDSIVTESMGGLLTLEFLPQSCKKLVLISSTAKFCSSENYPCGTAEKVVQRMIIQLKRDPQAVLDQFFKNVHAPNQENHQTTTLRKQAPLDIDELAAGLEYLKASDVREKVPAILIPVLLLHGMQDGIIPPSASEWLHAHLPDSKLKQFELGGHALVAHHFESVIKTIRNFILL